MREKDKKRTQYKMEFKLRYQLYNVRITRFSRFDFCIQFNCSFVLDVVS